MSTTIDQKVVEMRFDNKNFERNVQGTLSTLEKLKQKLNLTGASKGLENINTAANKVNMSGMSNAIETVHSKFSALEVMGITALANITNSAVNAGKRIVSALTIDPVKTGFQEYETQINAVQTILANTQKEGADIHKVNDALDQLNEYADQTIYNFTEMTRNIGTFTAAGVKLDTSVNAIKGIANLAAVSGSTSQQASTAMYQLSQALASGTVKLMDWNSVVNAGMGGQVFQDALKDTARVHGIAIDKMIKDEGSFKETLQKGWLTADILTETLEKFTYNVQEGTKEWDELKESLKKKGYTEEQAKEILKLGNTATEAATKVKTFTQLWDVLKEAAQSGWAQTWRLIVGDFEQAKSLFTPISEFLTGIIDGFSKARNKLLESALGKSFTGLLDKIQKSADGVKEVVESVKDYANIVDQIIGGKWGNGQSRWDKLAEAGYDWAHAQNLVNEKLGSSVRHATNYKEAQNGVAKSQEKVNETTAEFIASLQGLSDDELIEKIGEDGAKAFKEIEKAADKTGIPLKEFVENIDKIDGRFLLITGFKNLGQSLVEVFKAIGDAWRDAFPPMSSDTLFDIIAGFYKFSTLIRNNVLKHTDALTRTLKGLFAIIDLISMVVGSGLRIAFMTVRAILSVFNMNIFEFTALIGDALVAIRNWIEEHNYLAKGIETIVNIIAEVRNNIKGWIRNNEELFNKLENIRSMCSLIVEKIRSWTSNSNLLSTALDKFKSILSFVTEKVKKWIEGNEKLSECFETIQSALDKITEKIRSWISENELLSSALDGIKTTIDNVKTAIGNWIDSFKDTDEIGKNIIEGLVNGITSGVKYVIESILGLAEKMLTAICEFLGINSPSKKFFEIGQFIIQGLVNGLKWGLLGGGIIGAILFIANKLTKGFDGINLFEVGKEKIDEFIDGIENSIKNSKNPIVSFIRDTFMEIDGDEIKVKLAGIASALSMIALAIPGFQPGLAAMSTFFLFLNNIGKNTVSAITNAAVDAAKAIWNFGKSMLEALRNAIDSHSDSKETIKIGHDFVSGFITGIKEFAAKAWEGIKNFGAKCVELLKGVDYGKLFAAGLSVGVLLLGKTMLGTIDNVAKAASSLSDGFGPFKGINKFLETTGGAIKTFLGDISKGYAAAQKGKMIKDIAIAIGILAASIFVLSKIPVGTLWATIGAIFVLTLIIGGLATVMTLLSSKMNSLADAGKTSASVLAVVGVAASLVLVALAMRQLAKIDPENMESVILGMLAAVIALGLLCKSLRTLVSGNDISHVHKVGTMIKKIAWALLLLVLVIKVASMLDATTLIKGGLVVAALSVLVGGLISISRFAGQHAKSAGAMISRISIALFMLLGVIKVASMLEIGEVLHGIAVITLVGALFAALVVVSKFAGEHAAGAGWMLFQMSLAFIAAIGVVKIASMLRRDEIDRGIEVMAALGLLFVALIGVSKLAGENAIKAGAMILEISIALMIIVGVLYVLSKLNMSEIYPALGVVAILEVLMMGLIFASKSVAGCEKAIYGMTAMLSALIIGLVVLTLLDAEKVKRSVLALTTVMSALALMMYAAKSMADVKIGKILATLGLLVGLVGAIALLAWAMSAINPTTSISTATALSELLLAMSASLLILSKIGKVDKDIFLAEAALAALGLVVLELGWILQTLSGMDITVSIGTLTTLSAMLLVLSGVLAILNNIGRVDINTGAALLAMAALGLIVIELGWVLQTLSGFDISVSTETIVKLSVMLAAMAGVLGILSFIGPMATASYPAMLALAVFIGGTGIVLAALGKLTEWFPKMEEFINKGIPILEAIGSGIGKFIGSFVGGIGEGITSSLPAMGEDIASFAESISGIDPAKMEGVKALTDAIMTLTKADFLDSINIFGDTELDEFGKQLKPLGEGLNEFSTVVQNIDNMENVSKASTVISDLANAAASIPSDGIFGTDGIDDFGRNLITFAKKLVEYSTTVTGVDGEAVANSLEPAKKMIEIAKLVAEIDDGMFGTDGIDDFGRNINTFGKGLSAYATAVAGLDGEAVTNSIKPAEDLIKLSKKVSEIDDGMFGTEGIDNFGKDIKKFGKGLKDYSDETTDISKDNIQKSVDCITLLINVAQSIPQGEGWFTGLTGKGKDTGFLNDMVDVAKDMQDYGEEAAEIDVSAILLSETAFDAIKNVLNSMKTVDASGVDTFNSAIKSLSSISLDSFINVFSEASSKLQSLGSGLMNGLSAGIRNAQASVVNAVNLVSLKAMTKINSYRVKFQNSGKILTQLLSIGLRSGSPMVNTSINTVVTAANNKIKGYYENFKSSGKYVVSGFASGITEHTFAAEAAARAMAERALAAARAALQVNSPSKAFYTIGDYGGQGFVNALNDYGSIAYNSGYGMAEMAKDGLSRAITKVSDLISNGIDTQPTIRPVLDLTEVESGAGYLSSMFNDGPAIGVMSNLRAISSGMDSRNQNGSNSDVVSAIDKLRKDLGNVGGNTYNINGVSADGDDAINNAINELIRVIKVERRT